MSTRFSNHGEKPFTKIAREWILALRKDDNFCVFDLSKQSGMSISHASSSLFQLERMGMIKVVSIISSKEWNGRNARTKLYSFVKDVEIRHRSKHKDGITHRTHKKKSGPKFQVGDDVKIEFTKSAYHSVSKPKRNRAKELIGELLNLLAELDSLLAE